jgi:hypothetical protein
MPTSRVDKNVELVIDDLFELQRRLQQTPEAHKEERDRLMEIASGYLIANQQLIERAVDAWESTPEDELQRLQGVHRELDGSATVHSVRGIATQALFIARERERSSSIPLLFPISDDDLHMLDRVLEFAKYVVDTSDLSIQWHPVKQLLDDERSLDEP